jgi:3-methyladenine DNA glycosylase AlkD
MSALLKQIQKELESYSTPVAKAAALKFVPGATKVYGIRTPVLNRMAKQYKAGSFELVQELWKSGAFEEKVLAAKLLREVCKKDPEFSVKLVSIFSKDIADWAVCDAVGMQSLKPVAKKMQNEIFDLSANLLKSKSLWERRLSLVIIEVFTKDKLLQPEIMRRVKALANDEEYYVRKAVEWIKRNFTKENEY